jgi:type IV secretory pathway TraG/TraD family ATPase VirD4
MSTSNTVLHGSYLPQNPLPKIGNGSCLVIKGTYGDKDTPARFGIDDDVLSKHLLFVGGTGCGKTKAICHFVSQLKTQMTNDDVMIVFDTKGDYHSEFYSTGDVVLGNSSIYRNNSVKWNIFKEIVADDWMDENIIPNTQEICKALFANRVENNSSNPFFPNAARDTLAAIIIAFVRGAKNDEDCKREFLYNNELKDLIDGSSADELLKVTGHYKDFKKIESYIGGYNSQSQGVLAELYSVMTDYFIGVFADKGSFSIRNFVRSRGKKTLFIEYDLRSGSVLGPIYTLLFDLALKEAMGRQSIGQQNKGNVYLICDELKLLPHLEHMDDGINFGRSLGVKIIAGLQSIQQLYANYKEADANNIVAGFSSIFAFRSNEPQTREYVRKLFGTNVLLDQYEGTDGTTREEHRIGDTVEDFQLRQLRVGEAVIGLPGQEPFKFKFDLYR